MAHTRRTPWAAMAALCFAMGAFATTSAATTPAPSHAPARVKAQGKKAQRRAAARRSLARQVRANPAVVLKRGFIHKAQVNDFQIPAVVRLTAPGAMPEDTLDVMSDTSVFSWPQRDPIGPFAEPAPPQTTTITGSFGMQLDFSGTADGYGVLGAVETTQGQFADVEASGFDISHFSPTCSTNDNPCTGGVQAC